MASSMDLILWLFNIVLAVSTLAAVFMERKDAAGFVVLSQCSVSVLVISVMTIRAEASTPFRAGDAKNLYEEFAAYGYPSWFCTAIRVIKPSFAAVLGFGIIYPAALPVGAGGLILILIGAVLSHIKVGDPLIKSVPAFTLALLCSGVLMAYTQGCASSTEVAGPLAVFGTELGRSLMFGDLFVVCAGMVAFCLGVHDYLGWTFNFAVAASTVAAVIMDRKADAAGLVVLSQCLVSFAVVGVMTFRATAPTPFRGGDAKNLYEEFDAYGYPAWFCTAVRVIKPSFAAVLVIGIIYPAALPVGAGGILVLLIGAVLSHIKVKDPLTKSVPAFTLGLLCSGMLFANYSSVAKFVADEATVGTMPPAVLATQVGRSITFGVLLVMCAGAVVSTVSGTAAAAREPESREPLLRVEEA